MAGSLWLEALGYAFLYLSSTWQQVVAGESPTSRACSVDFADLALLRFVAFGFLALCAGTTACLKSLFIASVEPSKASASPFSRPCHHSSSLMCSVASSSLGASLAALDIVQSAALIVSPLVMGSLYSIFIKAGRPELLFLVAAVSFCLHWCLLCDVEADVQGLFSGRPRLHPLALHTSPTHLRTLSQLHPFLLSHYLTAPGLISCELSQHGNSRANVTPSPGSSRPGPPSSVTLKPHVLTTRLILLDGLGHKRSLASERWNLSFPSVQPFTMILESLLCLVFALSLVQASWFPVERE